MSSYKPSLNFPENLIPLLYLVSSLCNNTYIHSLVVISFHFHGKKMKEKSKVKKTNIKIANL